MASYAPNVRTTNATPQVASGFGPTINEDEVQRLSVFVFASDHSNGQAYWEFRGLLRRMAGQTTTGVFTQVVHNNTASAAAWACTMAVSNGNVEATLTGAAGATIDWLTVSDDPFGMAGAWQG